MCLCVGRLELDGALVGLHGLFQLAQAAQGQAQVVVGLGVGRLRLHCPLDQAGGFLRKPLLDFHDAQHVQRIRVFGACTQNLPVQALGTSEVTTLVQMHGLGQCLCGALRRAKNRVEACRGA